MSFLLNSAHNAAQSGAISEAARSVRPKDAEKVEGSTTAHVPVGGEDTDNRLHEGPRQGAGAKQAQGNAGQAGASQTGDTRKKLVRRKVRRAGVKTAQGARTSQAQSTEGAKAPKAQQPQTGHAGLTSGRGTGGNATRALMSGSRTTQASVQFDSAQHQQAQAKDQTNPLSPAGQRRTMLNNLRNMVDISMAQHTGGTAGEAYPRRETRQILMALKGLQASQTESKKKEGEGRRLTAGEFKLKEGSANSIMAIFADPPAPPADYEPLELIA